MKLYALERDGRAAYTTFFTDIGLTPFEHAGAFSPFRREPRSTSDLSDGWGSNSQWRTKFPRFYSDEDGLHLNWDGEVDIGEDPPADPADRLTSPDPLDERRELLLYRCFVRTALPHDEDDRFPFGDRLSLNS